MVGNGEATLALCPPTYMAAEVANNQWMRDIPSQDRVVNLAKAKEQWFNLYTLLTEECPVYLVPPQPGLQDQVYLENAGAVLPHLDKKVFLLSNFKAEGRDGEQFQAYMLLSQMGFTAQEMPYFFEGEAELRWLRDNIYLGGYGQRTSKQALDWIAEKFDAHIIPIEEKDPYLYHLDCSILPLAKDLVMAYTAGIAPSVLKELKDVATVIPVTKRLAYVGVTNSVRVGYTLFNASCISELPSKHPAYPSRKDEEAKNRFLETVCRNYGLELVFVNLSEMLKSGALLSCCVLHLGYNQVDLCKP